MFTPIACDGLKLDNEMPTDKLQNAHRMPYHMDIKIM